MPIYEFYCEGCNTLFNFFSRTVNTSKRPLCPKCGRKKLERQMSTFASIKRTKGGEDQDDLPVNEATMEKAMNVLAQEAQGLNEDDPRQAARLMRKFTDATGMSLGPGMEEALRRMEAGEDPDQVEAQMGDLMDEEEPFLFEEKRGPAPRKAPPRRDTTLYEL